MSLDRPREMKRAASRDAWALAVGGALALAGCAMAPAGTEAADFVCNSAQQCRVEVRVGCKQGACRIAVDHPRVAARGNDVVWVVVNRSGQSYAFADDSGIAFKSGAGRDTFRCHAEANGSRYACVNRRTPGTFEYGIRLVGAPAVAPLDPWVVN